MLSVSEALSKLFALAPTMPEETVPLDYAAGRVLLKTVSARRDQPPFAASAMDGYAVHASSATAGATLTVVDEAAAGHRASGALPPGGAIRIFTGAPVPCGADSILIQENATRSDNRITVLEPPIRGQFIRPAGGDFKTGFEVFAPRRLTARDVALLAAMNLPTVRVARQPVIALIPTGDELVLPGGEPGPDQILSSNNFGLAAILSSIGGRPLQCPIARDTPDSVRQAFAAAKGADFIISLGGASVGDHDLVADVMQGEGLSLDFHKIAMRPGKPLMAGRLGGAMMIGLPGNPVSALVCGEIFLRPTIEHCLGLPSGERRREVAILSHDLCKNGPREHYMRACLTEAAAGLPNVEVFESQDSSRLATLAQADALVVRSPNAPAASKGEQVEVISLS
ncbi:MAG: gephyrin-like molybdotransferase Glp [Pseudomonadota bacterium]